MNAGAQIEHAAAAWLARRDGGDWTADEQAALEAWLAESTAHRVAFLRLEAAWREAGRLKVLGAGTASRQVPARGAWKRSPYFADAAVPRPPAVRRGKPRVARHRRGAWLALAATLLVAIAATGGLLWRNATHVDRGAWRTAVGETRVVQLPDGSTATLAGDSELRIAMTRGERDLALVRGEAFFAVAKDHSRPFVVHARGYHVIAVGTRFDVRRDATGMQVVVTRGLVRLQPADATGQPGTDLPAGSVALVDNDGVVVRHLAPERAAEYVSWRNGYAVFHDTPLASAAAEFNRYNTHQIVIADPSLDHLRVGGHFRLDNSDAFVRLVQQMFPVRAERHGQRTVLSRRGDHAGAPD